EVMVIPLDAFPFLAPAGRSSGHTVQSVPAVAEGEADPAPCAFLALFGRADADLLVPDARPVPETADGNDAPGDGSGDGLVDGLAEVIVSAPAFAVPPPGAAPKISPDAPALREAATALPDRGPSTQPTRSTAGGMSDAATSPAQAASAAGTGSLPVVAGRKPPPGHGREAGDAPPLPIAPRGARSATGDESAKARASVPERPAPTVRAAMGQGEDGKVLRAADEPAVAAASDAPDDQGLVETLARVPHRPRQHVHPAMDRPSDDTGGHPDGMKGRETPEATSKETREPEGPSMPAARANPADAEPPHRIAPGAARREAYAQREVASPMPRDPPSQPEPGGPRTDGPAAPSGPTAPVPLLATGDQPGGPVPGPGPDADITIGRSHAAPAAAPPHAANHGDQGGAIGRQLAQGLDAHRGGPVEVTLSPEELGRVRMVLQGGETGLTLTLTAERPETLDLMRRHIDQLAQDFRDLGYRNLAFSFANEGGRQGSGWQGSARPDGSGQATSIQGAPAADLVGIGQPIANRAGRPGHPGDDRLDLRL
ncbi:MAG: flagellar hook-length control protein FliK, partial [Paracoccaceae bacterium]